jgi:aminomethyltransferase
VELAPRHDLALIAVQGPNAREKTWRAQPQIRADTETLAVFQGAETDNMLIARTGYTGEDGFELMLDAARAEKVWHSLQAQAVPPAGLGARDTLRLEAGMNLYGQDMDETVTPFEAALAWTVDLNQGRDFIGRSALVSRPVRWQLLGLVLLERGVMRAHQRVRTVTGDGVVTSGSFSPTLGRSIALARLPTDLSAGDGVEISVRDRWIPARVVKPPFVRYGTIRVTG